MLCYFKNNCHAGFCELFEFVFWELLDLVLCEFLEDWLLDNAPTTVVAVDVNVETVASSFIMPTPVFVAALTAPAGADL